VLKLVKTGDFKGENMKKLIVVALFLSVVVLPAFAREATIAELVERAVSKLDRPVPAGFQRMGMNTFMDDNVMLIVMNGLVFTSSFGSSFETAREAHIEAGRFHDFFDDSRNGWTRESFLYYRNNVRAIVSPPARRDDGWVAVVVLFSNQIF
jgi:hypothetical protein